MLEIEMKFRVPNAAAYEARLRDDFSLVFDAPRSEIDLFFRNEAAGFPTEGKALRIRRQDRRLVATFKGPRLDPKAKIREEIELPLGPALSPDADEASVEQVRGDWIRFFERLGFEPGPTVSKRRRTARLTFDGRAFEIVLDEVPPLGFFTEIETLAPPEELEAARRTTFALAERLGLAEPIPTSYLALLQNAASDEEL